jgi:very-short-patch-repair endonuclease
MNIFRFQDFITEGNKDELIEKSDEIYGFGKFNFDDVPSYFKSTEVLEIICKKHGPFKRKAYLFLSGKHYCPKCQKEKRRLTTEEFIKRANFKHNNTYDYSKVEYKGGLIPVDIICNKHGIFSQLPENHMAGSGCPYCNESKGEKDIERFLIRSEIKYKRQKTFSGCIGIGGRKLPFDFYLPEYNICIEYDGQQHFIPVFGEEKFKRLKINDKIKDEYCKKNGINLLRISYKISGYEKISAEIKRYLSSLN